MKRGELAAISGDVGRVGLPTVSGAPTAEDVRVRRDSSIGWVIMTLTMGISPVYPLITEDLGMSKGTLGLIVGLASLAMALAQIPIGALADHYPLKWFPVVALTLAGIGLAVWSLAVGPATWAIGELAVGLAVPTLQAGTITAVTIRFDATRRSKALSAFFVATGVGGVTSALCYGLISERFSWRVVTTGLAILAAATVPFVARTPNTRADKTNAPTVRERLRAAGLLFRRRTAIHFMVIAMMASAVSRAAMIALPFLFSERDRGTEFISAMVIAYMAGSLATPLIAGFGDRRGQLLGLWVSLGGFGVSMLGVVLSRDFVPGAAVFMCLSGAMGMSAMNQIQAGAPQILELPSEVLSTALGGLRTCQFFGTFVFAALVGVAIDAFGAATALLLLAGWVGLTVIVTIALDRATRRPVAGQAAERVA